MTRHDLREFLKRQFEHDDADSACERLVDADMMTDPDAPVTALITDGDPELVYHRGLTHRLAMTVACYAEALLDGVDREERLTADVLRYIADAEKLHARAAMAEQECIELRGQVETLSAELACVKRDRDARGPDLYAVSLELAARRTEGVEAERDELRERLGALLDALGEQRAAAGRVNTHGVEPWTEAAKRVDRAMANASSILTSEVASAADGGAR